MKAFEYTIGPGLEIIFPTKPAAEILDYLKRYGMRWNGRSWWRRKASGAADVVHGLRLLIDPPPPHRAQCWGCGSPDGTFRNCGPATPVWCDACYAKYLEERYKMYPWLRPRSTA